MEVFRAIEEDLNTMSDEELQAWNKGFLAALHAVVQQIQDDQIRILDKMIGLDKNRYKKRLLESRLGILDNYEAHYRKRIHQLESEL